MKANSITLSILDEQSALFRFAGEIRYGECVHVELSLPVTILRPEDYIKLPRIQDTSNSFLAVSFRTTERDGLLLYSSGQTGYVCTRFGYLTIMLSHHMTFAANSDNITFHLLEKLIKLPPVARKVHLHNIS